MCLTKLIYRTVFSSCEQSEPINPGLVETFIYQLKVDVLCDHLVSMSWSVPKETRPSYTLRKESRMFDRDVP